MRKRFNQPDRAAKPNQVISVNRINLIAETKVLDNHTEHVNYPGKPKTISKTYKQIVGEELGRGMYVGDQGKITAFVWLDREGEASQ